MDSLSYRPRTTFDDVRRPTEQEWAKWALMPQLLLWQAVALTCQIEPSSLPVEGVWRIAPEDSPASIFRDRFAAAIEHHHAGSLVCVAEREGIHTRVLVRVAEFVRWATGIGFSLPDEIAVSWGAPTASQAQYRCQLSAELPIDGMKAAWHQEQQEALAQQASDKGRALALKRHALTAHTKRVVLDWIVGKDFTTRAGAASEAAKHLATLPDVDPCKKETIDRWLKAAGWRPSMPG